jgi:cytochrome P450
MIQQDRVVKELIDVFGDSGRIPDLTDLVNLKYLECCFRESLRLYPSIPFIERAIEQDVQLGIYQIRLQNKLKICFAQSHDCINMCHEMG